MEKVRIGTSGWHYKHWRGPFYPEKLPASRMLEYYYQHFDTVEINNSFYRLPEESTFAEWRNATPPGFLFAVKASRFLTHNKKLKDPEEPLDRLFSRIHALDGKLGPVLFQLPPQWSLNLERLCAFLPSLPSGQQHAVEFRNETWNTPEVYEALRKYNVAWCQFHLAGYLSPLEITADFAYLRLHGPGGKYQGSYSDADLQAWAGRIHEWQRTLRAVYVYFDNDEAGYAVRDALRLRNLLRQTR